MLSRFFFYIFGLNSTYILIQFSLRDKYLDVYYFTSTGLHVTLDSLLRDNDLKNLLKDMVINSGRSYPVEKNNGIGIAAASEKQAEKVQEGIATIQINGSSSNKSSITPV